ncbi:class I SAM-dependent methyltransferase [Marinobacter sp. AL4B]|uniref:class I SAM-dependent methyltransferase n=1 Tax=Marinobacter sp. AL4B TaxID=2871173 RepID=UPI001CAA490A|nr:class I SAM-dependent methyltransferase [Marinobacter sp. AL4B]MBZ0333011.1 class I SAM-dependent methyltransferase [Marinobacter sp. AL4B]
MNTVATNQQKKHSMLAALSHDDNARQNFVRNLKLYLAQNISPRNRDVYESRVKPRLGSDPGLQDVEKEMYREDYFRFWSSMQRTSQELMWSSVQVPVERQAAELSEKFKKIASDEPIGSLSLNSDLKIPKYHTAVDIHCMPGGYHSDFMPDDVSAGAIYDLGVYIYSMGRMGPLNDDIGASTAKWLKENHPGFKPKKILDMGCSVGHSTLAWAEYYPEAEIHAIDVGAPVLRYAHARAEALGVKIHYHQMNAENLDFDNEEFDVITGSILMHETSTSASKHIFKECNRVLKKDGVVLMGETPPYKDLDTYDAFMLDWDTRNNNEPFWRASHKIEPSVALSDAGFASEKVLEILAPSAFEANLKERYTHVFQGGDFGGAGQWYVYGAWK